MTTENFTKTELGVDQFLDTEILGSLAAAGYTGVSVAYLFEGSPPVQKAACTVSESIDRATMLVALTTPRNLLAVNTGNLVVAPDGVSSGTIIVSGGTSGDTVDISFDGPLYVDALQQTFDGSGNATFTFGPCPSGQCWAKPVPVVFSCTDYKCEPISATVKFGPS